MLYPLHPCAFPHSVLGPLRPGFCVQFIILWICSLFYHSTLPLLGFEQINRWQIESRWIILAISCCCLKQHKRLHPAHQWPECPINKGPSGLSVLDSLQYFCLLAFCGIQITPSATRYPRNYFYFHGPALSLGTKLLIKQKWKTKAKEYTEWSEEKLKSTGKRQNSPF